MSGDMWNEVRIFENIAYTSIHDLRRARMFYSNIGDRIDRFNNKYRIVRD